MRFVADLHLHSRYSRATSEGLTLPALHRAALTKGITVVGTGDYTHPGWRAEIRDQLEPAEPGLWRLKPDLERALVRDLPRACQGEVRFVLQVEISNIYKKAGKTRKNHNLVYLPSLEAVERMVERLGRIGNLASDGRPILGLDARDLLEIVLGTDPAAWLVPAHVWTPWFSLLGSKSGFDSLRDCFGDLAGEVFAAETGLSSDPAMNWRVSELDRITLMSNSDAHSPEKLGREANLFDTELAFSALREAVRSRRGFLGTIEFFPEEGKYHLDGHRKCGVRLQPEQSRELGSRCPVCGEPLTVGVLARVAELADRPEGHRPAGAADYRCLVPLAEVLAETLGVGSGSKRVRVELDKLHGGLGPELRVLADIPLEEIARVGGTLLGEAVRRMRAGELHVDPGYDGEYGKVRLFGAGERDRLLGQMVLRGASAVAPAPSRASTHRVPLGAERRAVQELVPDAARQGSDLGRELDPAQLVAATFPSGPLLVVAGPGTGKTRTLVGRVVHQIQSGSAGPAEILAITFTRQAAQEIEDRLRGALGDRAPMATTFHGFGRWLMAEYGEGAPAIIGEVERSELLLELAGGSKRAAKDLGLCIGRAKQTLDPSGELGTDEALRAAFERYQANLAARGMVDLDDLLLGAVRLLEGDARVADAVQRRFCSVLVDEYQDVNDVQARLVELISPTGQALCVIGDPDQAIYGFRGARPGHFARFAERLPNTRRIELRQSYRLTRPVASVAASVLGASREMLCPLDGPRVEIVACPTAPSEAEQIVVRLERLLGGTSSFAINSGRGRDQELCAIGFGDVAVLTRTKFQQREIARALAQSGIPCHLVAEDEPHDPRAEQVAVMTMHAAKGREFAVAFVAGVERGLVPLEVAGRSVDPEEERRLLYVAITRARHLCVISHAERRVLYGQALPGGPSTFLASLPSGAVVRSRAVLPERPGRSRQLGLFDGRASALRDRVPRGEPVSLEHGEHVDVVAVHAVHDAIGATGE
jgi:DNA helicase II / ATP-dependent DNA helicase PcrA